MAEYIIKRTNEKTLNIASGEWDNANIAKITYVNWEKYPDGPYTEVRVLYNDDGIFVRFESDEENVVAEFKNVNDDVFMESTCEIFFKPDFENPNYFNFEINAIGTPLIGWGPGRERERLPLKNADIFEIESIVNKDRGFKLKLFIPFSFMKEYSGKLSDYFLGNFQKCCEIKKPQHFLSHFPIRTERPDFHNPASFDKFVFEK